LPTRLYRYAEGVLEAAWLAAVIVVPVFFNIYSSRIFEPDKISLLRTIALVILAAWLIKIIEGGGLNWNFLPREKKIIQTIWNIPLLIPVLAVVVVYILATILSINPRVSLWGSYQRMQGTYTTFSYLVIFISMLANLRKREQVERMIGVIIISSLPISLYGVLQHFGIDPIPWGGDVTRRIAANMGNSIFVAAYLVLVFPLTFMRIVDSFEALMEERGSQIPNFTRSTSYVFIASLQVIALYYTGSRGPWLGWGISLVFIWLGLSLIWRARWLTISGVILAISAVIFLVLLNIPNGPLENLRSRSEFGRLGELLDAESRTGRVRTLIWSGAAELVQPHEPLEYPDGRKDPFNFIRPIIGYGPESMYVAYNRFYPPELTQVEKRNASPDRSHNETWDSVIITGVLGLIAYLSLFGFVIYYGLKWLELVNNKKQRNIFIGLFTLGGIISSIIFLYWEGINFLGVALPFGMIMGVLSYLILISIFSKRKTIERKDQKLRAYFLLGLLAALMAHFVEINFGIAIVATRTYFWVYAALLVLIGWVFPYHGIFFGSNDQAEVDSDPSKIDEHIANNQSAARQKRKIKSRRRKNTSNGFTRLFHNDRPFWLHEAIIIGLIIAVLLMTLGFDFITNPSRSHSATEILWNSFTRLGNSSDQSSSGILTLLLTSWIFGVLLLASESSQLRIASFHDQVREWIKIILVALAISLILAFAFWIWHAESLAALSRVAPQSLREVLLQVRQSEGLLTSYYIGLFVLIFFLAFAIPRSWSQQGARYQVFGSLIAVVSIIGAFGIASTTNLRVIQADIAFKTADIFSNSKTWPVAIEIYNHANDLAPAEDYYYLFLGRAYLEQAKLLDDLEEREKLIAQAANDLKSAQNLNPLNTDHTANLARLHSLWSSYTVDPALKNERALASSEYFSQAVNLSPNNARLWDEWAVLLMNILNQPEEGYKKLQNALEIDPYYDWTYGLMGDYFSRYASVISDDEKEAAFIEAKINYQKAIKLAGSSNDSMKYGYAVALGGVESDLGNVQEAIDAYELALSTYPNTPDRYKIELALVRLYLMNGDENKAIEKAWLAIDYAPEDQKQAVQDYLMQLGIQP